MKIISLLFALTLLASCGQGDNKTQSVSDQEFKSIKVSEFISDAGPFVDDTVKISGTVVHVCRYGGQKMFIIGEDGEDRVRITTGEDITEFDVALEGDTIEVTGIVKEIIINETYLAEQEAEVTKGDKNDRGENPESGVGQGDYRVDDDAEHANENLEDKLAKIQ